MATTIITFDQLEQAARHRWGTHPLDWPIPPRRIPRWWQIRERRKVRDLETVFGFMTDAGLSRYWTEAHKGQSIYEDVGGYYVRCFMAMCGFEVEDPPLTYSGYVGHHV